MVDKTEEENIDTTEETEEEQQTEEQTEEQGEDTSEETSEENSDEPTLKDVMNMLKAEREERKKLQSKLDTVVSSNKQLSSAQLDSLKADIKAHGINPDDLIKGLNDKQAMGVLKNLKANMAGRRTLSTTPGKTGKPGGSSKPKSDEVFEGALRFLGMDMETYLELSGKKKGE